MTKYRIWFDEIERVEVDRETDASVFIGGRRRAKKTGWGAFFDTIDEAKAYWCWKAENDVDNLKRRLESAEIRLANAMAYDEASGDWAQ